MEDGGPVVGSVLPLRIFAAQNFCDGYEASLIAVIQVRRLSSV